MKTTLWLTTFSMFLTAPLGFSKTEVETLRSTVTEQERQIRQLEDENMKLRSLNGQAVKPPAETASISKTPVPSPAATAASSAPLSYTVRAGDTLEKIARSTGSSAATLAKLNNIKDAKRLSIGQKLKLPGEAKTAAVTVANSPAPVAPSATVGNGTYVIRDGDTFYSIARKYKTTPESIAAANPGIKASELRTGQLIRLNGKTAAASAPVKSSETAVNKPAAAKPAAEPKAAEAKQAPQPKAVAETPPASEPKPLASRPAAPAPAPAPVEAPAKTAVHSVTIDGEMTYGEFASKHNTRIERLNELNGLDLTQNTVLAKGSELYVTAQP